LEEAKHAYERAAFTFLPSNRPNVKIALALILEEQGKIDEARKVFTALLESS
jgi:pre-mRNA-processing factor 39